MAEKESPAVAAAEDAAHGAEAYDRCIDALLEKDRLGHTGRLVRGLIHNINGPLQNMSMLVEMLVKGHHQMANWVRSHMRDAVPESPDSFREWETVEEKHGQRFDRLVQQISVLADMLRDFMVIQEIERNESEIDINLVLNTIARVFRADLFCKHNVQVELRLTDNLPLVRILGRDLIPALMHLFENAVTAIRLSPEKVVVLETRREKDGRIFVVFHDTGCGPVLDEEGNFEAFRSGWPEEIVEQEGGEKHPGIGLFAVRRRLAPYGVRVHLERQGAETLAVLEIPT